MYTEICVCVNLPQRIRKDENRIFDVVDAISKVERVKMN